MNRSDWILVALNSFLLAWAFIGFASMDDETLIVGAMLAMLVSAINVGALYRRRKREREPRPERRTSRRRTETDEMDAATVLDIDARLEALERAQIDAADAARWRALVESGQITAPSAAPLETGAESHTTGAGSRV